MKVEIFTPSDATAKITGIVPQRRGQILGYDARPGWPGWDVVEATMPQSEIGDLIIELRSATAGVASYQRPLRPHGRTHRPAGRRGDERQRQGGLSRRGGALHADAAFARASISRQGAHDWTNEPCGFGIARLAAGNKKAGSRDPAEFDWKCPLRLNLQRGTLTGANGRRTRPGDD